MSVTSVVPLSSIVSGSGLPVGAGGFAINGFNNYDLSGYSVSSAGDVNGDGLADLIVGASGAEGGGSYRGQSYVVFGGDFSRRVAQLGTNGVDTLTGTTASDVLVGGQGNDSLSDGTFNDVILYGGAGNDSLRKAVQR